MGARGGEGLLLKKLLVRGDHHTHQLLHLGGLDLLTGGHYTPELLLLGTISSQDVAARGYMREGNKGSDIGKNIEHKLEINK